MAALMIPCGKLTDRYGRIRLFRLGLAVYAIGALLSAVAPGLGLLILGNSIFEGVGTALLIPPVYILTTLMFTETVGRARAFGAISAAAGLGAAAGPLIGGLITSTLLTLFVVPVMYTFLDDLGSWVSARLTGAPRDTHVGVGVGGGAGAPLPQPAAGD